MDTENYLKNSVVHKGVRILKSWLDKNKELEGQEWDCEKFIEPNFCVIDNKFTTEWHDWVEQSHYEDPFGNITADMACSKCSEKRQEAIKWVGIPKDTTIILNAYDILKLKENLNIIHKKTKNKNILNSLKNVKDILKLCF